MCVCVSLYVSCVTLAHTDVLLDRARLVEMQCYDSRVSCLSIFMHIAVGSNATTKRLVVQASTENEVARWMQSHSTSASCRGTETPVLRAALPPDTVHSGALAMLQAQAPLWAGHGSEPAPLETSCSKAHPSHACCTGCRQAHQPPNIQENQENGGKDLIFGSRLTDCRNGLHLGWII